MILYTFFEKPTNSNQMLHRQTALSENTKMATINSEILRRMLDVSELLPIQERIIVLDKVPQKLCNSGYSLPEIRRSIVGALTGYQRRLAASMKNVEEKRYRPLHESSENSLSDRLKKKLSGKSTWVKGKSKVDKEQEE